MRNDRLAVWNWNDHHPSRIGFCIHGWASRKGLHILCCTVPREKWLFPLIKEYSFRFKTSYLHDLPAFRVEPFQTCLFLFCANPNLLRVRDNDHFQCTGSHPFQLCYVRRNLGVPAAGPQAKRYVHHVHTRHLDGFVWKWNCNVIKSHVSHIMIVLDSRFNP